jgi:hypothetical protein
MKGNIMGKKSKSVSTTSQTVYGNTTTTNPYVTSKTDNSGTTSSLNEGTAIYDINEFREYKRSQKEQTTNYIVDNPVITLKEPSFKLSKKTIFLEYKNKNFCSLLNKTGYEIGLKDGEEILLKLNEDYYNQLISLPLDNIYLQFKYESGAFCLPTFKGESSEECKKRLSSLFEDEINFRSLSPDPFTDKTINFNCTSLCNFCFCKCMLGGTTPLEFSDVSKGKTKELKFSKSAPSWRYAKEGLNIFGICENDECKAHQKEVVYIPKSLDKGLKFNLNDNIDKIICPICSSIIKVKTCGFWKCEYQFIGKKIEKGKLIDYNSMPKETKDDKFEYFDPSENGNVLWKELIIYVIPKQKIKYSK